MVKLQFTVLLLFIITLTTQLNNTASAKKFCPSEPKSETSVQKLAARDAITISIQQVREMRKFIHDIPRLKLTRNDTALLSCMGRLISDLSDVKSTLNRMRHMRAMTLRSDATLLKRVTGHSVGLGRKCSESVKNSTDVDGFVASMLTRKLDDLSMVVGHVFHHVSEIERGEYRGQSVEKSSLTNITGTPHA